MKIPDKILDAVDWSKVPQPIIWLIIAMFLAVAWQGRSHFFGDTTDANKNTDEIIESVEKSVVVIINVIEEETQLPVVGAQIITEIEEGSETSTTDSLGSYKVTIPESQSLRVRVLKDGYFPYDQILNLSINPEQPKRIVLKPTNSIP